MKIKTLSLELLRRVDAYWRAANYLSVGQIYLVFVGLSGMHVPPREEAKEGVAKCRAAGIRVVMITGDHPHTATAIARESASLLTTTWLSRVSSWKSCPTTNSDRADNPRKIVRCKRGLKSPDSLRIHSYAESNIADEAWENTSDVAKWNLPAQTEAAS